MRLVLLGIVSATLVPFGRAADPDPVRPFFSPNKRIPWTTSHLHGTPDPPPPYRVERIFPKQKFDEPVFVIAEPGTNLLLVVERDGKIWRFRDDDTQGERELFIDLGDNTYSLAFHPNYRENGTLFIFRNLLKDGKYARNRISKFHAALPKDGDAQAGGDTAGRVCDPKSEQSVIEWDARGHNGGDMAFGPDGMLYLTSGDGEPGVDGPDPSRTGQDLSDLLSGILRIDVDHPDQGKQYSVPKDNPFVDLEDARPELWAFGLRNPWRFSIDPETGQMWIGDNGEEMWEAIYLGKRGANYGWSVLEGSHSFNAFRTLGPGPVEPPIAEHPHSESRSIMGGLVSRGKRLKDLEGAYIYGDHETGKIWGLRWDGKQVTWQKELADSKRKIIAFGQDRHGEIIIVTFGGELMRLVPAEAAKPTAPFPRKLSETGLFSSVADHRPAMGMIPYSVNAPAWADGATIERYIGVPGDAKITYKKKQGWEPADGTAILQTFSLPTPAGGLRRVETRLLHRFGGEWYGYSYRWNEDQADALLVDKHGTTARYDVASAARGAAARVDKSPSGEKNIATQTWTFPSRAQCFVCHSMWGPRYLIGVSTPQMNRTHNYGGVKENQISVLARLGILDKAPKKSPDRLPRLADPHDAKAELHARARAYLHGNCAHCHRFGGTGNARIRLDIKDSDKETHMVGMRPDHGSFGIADARLVAPGQPDLSVIYYRLAKLGRGRMPHLGSQQIDAEGLALIHDWIASLPTGDVRIDPTLRKAVHALRDAATDAPTRSALIDQLLATTSGALVLLDAMDRNQVSTAVAKETIDRTVELSDRNVRDLFEAFLPEAVRAQRLGDSFLPEQVLRLEGNADRGRRLFSAAEGTKCISCHKAGGEGVEVGPDLGQLTQRTTRAELLESLIDPSKVIDPKFQTYVVETVEGRLFSGLLVSKNAKELVLRDAQNKLEKIPVKDVDVLEADRNSLMPVGLLRDLSAQEAADLLEFLHSLNKKK